jgi:DNA polymerase-1
VALDSGKTFRDEMFPLYKAQRKECPEELKIQFPLIFSALDALQVSALSVAGFEADDVLGAFAHKIIQEEKDAEVFIATGDRDILQVIDDRITVLLPQKGPLPHKPVTKETVTSVFGVSELLIPDFKGLSGDASDNIPGVKGIGPKTALSLLEKYYSLDGIYENIENISGAVQTKLKEQKEQAYLSKKLATIVCDMDLVWESSDLTPFAVSDALFTFLEEYRFFSLMKRLKSRHTEKKEEENRIVQNTLF